MTGNLRPKTPPVLVSFERLKEALGQGVPLPGNLVVVSTKEDLANLRLWQALCDPAALRAVAVDKAAACDWLTKAQVSLTRDRCGSRLESVGLVKVSDRHSGPWVQLATTVTV